MLGLPALPLSLAACDLQRVEKLVESVSTEVEVRHLLRRPAKTLTLRFDLKNEAVWDWRVKQHGQDSKVFSVTFDAAGRVLRASVGDDPREARSARR